MSNATPSLQPLPSRSAWVFPGQGSQYVGMGLDLARDEMRASTVFNTADHTLGFTLSDIIFNGSEAALTETSNQQPAILAVSIAYLISLRERGVLPDPEFVAGHSLGEYSALVATGSLELEDAIRLVRTRGELMQKHGAGSMAALIGLDPSVIDEITEETGVEIANYNAPGQTTVSGRTSAVEAAMTLAKERGARRALMLQVSGAFHSSLMEPVVEEMTPLLDQTAIAFSPIPLVTNVDAKPIQHPDDIRAELLAQICASVRWIDVITTISNAGVTTFYEVGPGKVLSGLISRIVKGADTVVADALLKKP